MDDDNYFYDCVIEMEKMHTPWFLNNYIYEKHKDVIIETIELNDYLFFENGELIPLNYYPTKSKENTNEN